MSVVTGLRSCRISLIARREPPSKRASFFKINVGGIFTFKRERHVPVPTDCNAPNLGATAFSRCEK
jgi:hypothetical protein